MKRYLWLLALPWTVIRSTTIWPDNACENKANPIHYELRYKNMFAQELCCAEAKEACEDMAEALNEAHKRREEIIHGVDYNATPSWYPQSVLSAGE